MRHQVILSVDVPFIHALPYFRVMQNNSLSFSLSFDVAKNNPWNDNGAAGVDGPDGEIGSVAW